MKAHTLFIALGLSACTLAAQEGLRHDADAAKNSTPEQIATRSADRARKNLSLNDDQYARWQTAALERARANAPIKQTLQGSTTPAERQKLHSDAKKNNDAFDKKVSEILTPDQLVKYREEVLRHDKRRHHQKGAKMAPPPPEVAPED
jgi:hypothetical protein